MSFIGQVTTYGRFAWGLRRFLKERATAEVGREVIIRRLRDRETNFLALMKGAVFENPASRHAPLLRMAGCVYGDFESSVSRNGIESTLQKLQSGRIDIGFTWTSVPNAQFAAHAESRLQFSAEGISAALVTAQRNGESFHPGALEFYREMGWVD